MIIDITPLLQDAEATETFKKIVKRVIKDVESLPDDAVDKIKEYVLLEVRAMLGLTPLSEETVSGIKPIFSDDIWDIYEEANENCYFCSDAVDPHDEPYGFKRGACLACEQKLRNFLLAAGVKKDKVGEMMRKARLNF